MSMFRCWGVCMSMHAHASLHKSFSSSLYKPLAGIHKLYSVKYLLCRYMTVITTITLYNFRHMTALNLKTKASCTCKGRFMVLRQTGKSLICIYTCGSCPRQCFRFLLKSTIISSVLSVMLL